ncbi:uncharacterized protein LOC116023757 [Ipomoea triloba]|uniref:uncharacterized protein LOC116023757 n=1 Tax=Ipomoea triloba TaxID=35885 RepID=UPI00125D647A|nr:uncharacterized protein LOC116023757 [Ipomoea triloba]
MSGTNRMEGLRVKLKYENCFVVDAVGRCGGLALLWNGGLDIEVVGYSNHYIDTTVRGGGVTPNWRLTGYYSHPNRRRRQDSWDLLRYLSSTSTLPWVVLGDFNDILWDYEKKGRVPHPTWLLRGFREAVRESGLGRSIEGGSSDHLPILLRINSGDRVRVRRRPRYDNAWGRNAACRNIVEHAWSITQGLSIVSRLEECGRRVWGWGSYLNRVEREEFRRCKDQLGNLRGRRDAEGVRRFGEVQNRYLSLLQSQSDHWKQRAKEWWYTMGDQNSKFFHNSVNRKRRRNKIHALRGDGGTMVTGKTQMGVIICRYFTELFTSHAGTDSPVLRCLESRISSEQNTNLTCPISSAEVKAATFSMHPDKSPGPDGLSPAFYQQYWDILGDETTGVPGGFGALKVDMSKAYDRVEWNFMGRVMLELGFSERWVALMRECVSTVQYRVLVEGNEWGQIDPGRDLRQGDPLSPYLFLIVAEGLSAMLREQEREGALHGFRVARGAPAVSHFRNVHSEDKEAVCEVLGIHEQ